MLDVHATITSINQEGDRRAIVRATESGFSEEARYRCSFPLPAECYGFEVDVIVSLTRATSTAIQDALTGFHLRTHQGTAYRGDARLRLLGIGELLNDRGPVTNSSPHIVPPGVDLPRTVTRTMLRISRNDNHTEVAVEELSTNQTYGNPAEFTIRIAAHHMNEITHHIGMNNHHDWDMRLMITVDGVEQTHRLRAQSVEYATTPAMNEAPLCTIRAIATGEERRTGRFSQRHGYPRSHVIADSEGRVIGYGGVNEYGQLGQSLSDDARLFVDGEEVADNVRVELPRLNPHPVQASIRQAAQAEQSLQRFRDAFRSLSPSVQEMGERMRESFVGIDLGQAESRTIAAMLGGGTLTGEELSRTLREAYGVSNNEDEPEEPQTDFLDFPTIAGIAREVLDQYVGDYVSDDLMININADLIERGLTLVSTPEQMARGEIVVDYSFATAIELGLVDEDDTDEYGEGEGEGLTIRRVTTARQFGAVRSRGKRMIQIGDDE